MRKEIEVKAKVASLNEVEEKLKVLGCIFSDATFQNDVTFVDENYGDYAKFQPRKNILRIRTSEGKYLFTIKQPQNNEMDAIEHETEISDPQEFKEALNLMGYKKVVEIRKTRKKAKYRDYEICLDEVEELGSFVEVEKITDEENSEAIQQELFDFLVSIEVDPKDRVFQGYDTLIYLSRKNENN